ncbi:hypothetical protein ACM66B_003229 [Microbotryomycetes sp. NB124-2]
MQSSPQARRQDSSPPLGDNVVDALEQGLNTLATAFKTYVAPLIPSPSLVLQSLGFVIVLCTCLSTSILAWTSFYTFTRATSLGTRERVWLQYGKFQAPHAVIDLASNPKIDLANVPYDVTLDLVVPVSERNLDVGNFMVELNAVAANGQSIVNVSRPATLVHPARHKPPPPPPPPKRKPSVFALLYPSTWVELVLGPQPPPVPKYEMDETQRLRVPLLEQRLLAARRVGAAKWLHVQVGRDDAHSWFDPKIGGRGQQRALSPGTAGGKERCDDAVSSTALAVAAAVAAASSNQGGGRYSGTGAWAGGRGELQIYESWLNFDARLTGLKYALYYHPILSFLVFVTMFTTLEMLGALVAWACWSASSGRRTSKKQGQYSQRPRHPPPSGPPSYTDSGTSSPRGRGGVKREEEDITTTTTLSSSRERDDSSRATAGGPFARAEQYERDMYEQEQERQRRLRGLSGIVGMSDVGRQGGVLSGAATGRDDEDGDETEARTTTEEGTETEEEASSWEGIEREQGEGRIKAEDDDEGLTRAGSATTRATRSTFGPSVAGASTSARTASSAAGLSSDAVLRERRRVEEQARERARADE